MDKMRMESVDITMQNIDKIGALFPNCITESVDENGRMKKAVNFELLKQMLSPEELAGEEAYEFTWVGKKAAIVEANKPIKKTLRPCPAESKNWDTTENLYIEGDNLEVLKLLQESYLGKVKMIYIDPPYNTGNDFIYRDNFARSAEEYDEQMGMFDEETGDRLFRNTDSNGRFHSDWCSMIYSRLMLARNLLAENGVIFVSIDDNEESTLRQICDEIFNISNFVGCLVLQTATDNNPRQINTEHEYILCYAKNHNELSPWFAPSDKAQLIQDKYNDLKKRHGTNTETIQAELRAWIKNNSDVLQGVTHYDNVDNKGVFHDGDIANTVFGGYRYTVLHPVTHKPCKIPEKGFRFAESTMQEMLKNDEIMFGADETTLIKPKKRLENAKDVLRSVIYEDGRASTKQFESLMDRDIFQNPKSPMILERLIGFVTEKGDIVVDFFSGSGTTAEAVMRLNAKRNMEIKSIMVQLPEDLNCSLEKSDSRAKKTLQNAIAFLDSIGKKHNICEIGKERIRRAGEKIKSENPLATQDLDVGFRVFKLDDSNMKNVYYSAAEYGQQMIGNLESNIREDRSDLDLLFGCLLEWGLPLSLPYTSESMEGCTVHTYNDGDLIACFSENIPDAVIKEIAGRKPLRAVFRDSSFADSPSKINVFEIFKLLAPDTRVKVI
ncbi:MAG: site-specific DNA-methyltransferase [Eubacteriales bacterium]|nr:site-specific DNA-methyltransferase [Eubacteriales bacterium]